MLPILNREPASRVTCVASDGTTQSHQAGELTARTQEHAARLPTRARVAITDVAAYAQLCWFLAADRAGCATLITDTSWTRAELDAVCADAEPHVFAPVDAEPPHDISVPRPVGDERTWFYLPTTSGSSGRPKVLVRTRESWLRSYDVFTIGMRPDDQVLVCGPLSSSLFLFAALHTLHVGADLRLLDHWSPTAAVEECRHATVAHLVPAMLAALVDRWERDPAALAACRLRMVVCGGARVDAELETRLAEVLPDCELVEYYGSAETSLVAIRHSGREGLRPVVDVAVHGAADGAGELWARSQLGHAGYLRHGELVPAEHHHGWLAVGDRAVRHQDGSLEVLGRKSSTINNAGTLVPAEEVESVLRAVPGVLDAVVAGTPHPRFGSLPVAVLETVAAGAPTLADLRARARDLLRPEKRPRQWLQVERIPRTASGKPARALITERLAAGTLNAVPYPGGDGDA